MSPIKEAIEALPPLPKPVDTVELYRRVADVYTAEQMREYALAALRAMPAEPVACQSCGIEATREVPIEATDGFPGPYCDECGPGGKPIPPTAPVPLRVELLSSNDGGRPIEFDAPVYIPPGCSLAIIATPHTAPVLTEAEMPDVDWLANVIRLADGNNTMGAGELAERIVEAMQARLRRAGGGV